MSITLDLQPEQVLTVTTGAASSCTLRRSANSAGGVRDTSASEFQPISLTANCVLEIGPFSNTRRHIIDDIIGDVTYTLEDIRLNYNNLSTGAYRGGALSINSSDNTKFDIAAGKGAILDNYTDPENPIVTRIEWSAFTALTPEYLDSAFTSYIGVDRGGNVVQFSGTISASIRRDYVLLGLLVHTGNSIVEGVSGFVNPGYDVFSNFSDLASAIGVINLNGNKFSANASDLKLAMSAGKVFRLGGNFQNSVKSPNVFDTSSQSAPYIFKPYQDGSDGFTIDFPLTQNIDPTKYDDGSGTLANVPSNRWQIQRIFLDPVNGDVIVQYGQNVYLTKAAALDAITRETFNKNPVLNDTSLRGFLIINENCTDLSDEADALFISADKYGQVPSEGAVIPLTVGSMELQATELSSDFNALPGFVYMIDNSSNAVTVTLPANDGSLSGQTSEFWITSSTATHNIVIEAPDHTYSINDVSGSDPDPVQATISTITQSFYKVTIRYCSSGNYMIDYADLISV